VSIADASDVYAGGASGTLGDVSLRGSPVEQTATLPDGRVAAVWVGVLDDPYVAKRELDTVSLELRVDGEVVASVNTVLDAADDSAGRALLHEVVAGLESGRLEPTAGALEPLADELR
jgi:hypothetical protein